MHCDIRASAARYYDLNPDFPDDISFYRQRIPSAHASVLELGCGTGRVLVPLVKSCSYIRGIDSSEAMLAICRQKLNDEGVDQSRARADVGDITAFSLDRTFDFIIAPFRAFQNLETDDQVRGLFECVRAHLGPGGTCILNVFRPYRDAASLRREWCTEEEQLSWEVPVEGGRVACYDKRARMDPANMVLYPDLIYRRYQGTELVDEAILKIAMRCYYPEQFLNLITGHGFTVLNCWGGYNGEHYGEGPELVVQFA